MSIVVTGGSSGLGMQLIEKLFSVRHQFMFDWSHPQVDVGDQNSVAMAAHRLQGAKVDVLINCAGVNYINWFDQITEDDWDRVMNTNAKGIWLTTRALLEQLRGGTVVNIISNASHMPMTHSAAYNASKGAAHILTLQMARELKKTHDITVFGVSPNKMSGTGMSAYIDESAAKLRGWTPEQMREYQLTSLPAGDETPPAMVAEFIAFLLQDKEHHRYLHGTVIPYGA